VCKIWTAVDIHHCDGCGFCRVGKAEDIFHCETCEACFSRSTQAEHVCAKTKLKGERCPLCLESGKAVWKAALSMFRTATVSYPALVATPQCTPPPRAPPSSPAGTWCMWTAGSPPTLRY
jgi:hypothetical protein